MLPRPAMLVLLVIVVLSVAFVFSFARVDAEPTLPWKTFSAAAADATGSDMGECPNGPAMRVQFERDGADYLMFYAPESGRILFVLFEDGKPSELGFGKIDPSNRDVIPALRWQRFDPALHRGPCTDLFPPEA